MPADPSPSAGLRMTPGAPNVIKLGGSLLEDAQRRHAVLAEVAKRWHCGEQLVIVHGGGKHIDSELAKLGIAKKTHGGLRITDVAGVLDTNGEVVSTLHLAAVEQWISNVSGGMKPKLQAALHALQNGVSQIAIGENGGTNLVAA